MDSSLKASALFRNRLEENEKKNDILNKEFNELRNSLNQTNDAKQFLLSEVDRLRGKIFLTLNYFFSKL